MKLIRNIRLFVLLLIGCETVFGQLPQYGLHFHSHNSNIDKRTSLVLNNGESYNLNKQDVFTIDFDIFLRNETVKFGYIFRIISNKEENFDFIINNEPSIFFVMNSQDFKLKSVPYTEAWNHVTLTFDKKQNVIILRFNDEIIDCPMNLKSLKSLNISFGQCEFKNFLANDVSPFILKNVQITKNGKEIHHWALQKHAENIVYDELKHKPALVHNPYWLLDDHAYWKKIAEFSTEIYPQITFDSIGDKIYLLNEKELIAYSLASGRQESFPNLQEIPLNKFANHLLFDPISQRLLFYGYNSDKISFYDFDQNRWMNYDSPDTDALHAHHNRYISPIDSALYLFGGYGFYKYNSDFLQIDLRTGERKSYDLSHTIIPRYLSAMGGNATGDKIYILGGRGAEMGRQELSPKNFFDLYEYDLKTNKVKYLFDIDKEGEEGMVYSNSLMMLDDSVIYALAYPNGKYTSNITLRKINLDTQNVISLADTIDFFFRDISSFCDLYYSSHLSKLIAVVSYSEDQSTTSRVNIYTLEYPPLSSKNVLQTHLASNNKLLIFIFIGVACLLVFFFALGTKLRPSGKLSGFLSTRDKNQEDEMSSDQPTEIGEFQKDRSFYDFKRSSISFLGGFQVFNKDGKDITGDFTPTLKYILVLIVLYTLKNNKGISSSKLQELLWFDKTEEAARNNRSVNVRKLRVLLQELGNVDITNQNSYWIITFPDDVLLDYKEIIRLIQEIQNEEVTKTDDLLRLLELLDQGVMLPNIQLEWVDNFKTDYSNAVIDVLMHVVNNPKNTFYNQQDIQLKISDCILKIDPINEEALSIKCRSLYKMGKKGLAKAAFDNFAKEYKTLLGDTYSGSIKDLTEEN